MTSRLASLDIRVLLFATALLVAVSRAQWGWKNKLDTPSKDLNEDVNEAVRLHEESDFVSSLPYYLRALRRCQCAIDAVAPLCTSPAFAALETRWCTVR